MLSSSAFFLLVTTSTTNCLRYVPWTEEKEGMTACGIPVPYNASKEWANKRVVLFATPGECRRLDEVLLPLADTR